MIPSGLCVCSSVMYELSNAAGHRLAVDEDVEVLVDVECELFGRKRG